MMGIRFSAEWGRIRQMCMATESVNESKAGERAEVIGVGKEKLTATQNQGGVSLMYIESVREAYS